MGSAAQGASHGRDSPSARSPTAGHDAAPQRDLGCRHEARCGRLESRQPGCPLALPACEDMSPMMVEGDWEPADLLLISASTRKAIDAQRRAVEDEAVL